VRIERLSQAYHVDVRWAAFPLYHDLPPDGRSLEDVFKGTSIDLSKVEQRLKEAASREGLPLGERKRIYNTRLAHELAKWAEDEGHGQAFHATVFHAGFVDGRNISDPAELTRLAASIGLNADEAKSVLTLRTLSGAVEADLRMAKELDVTAVPTFVMDGEKLTGAHPYEELEALARRQGAENRMA
jgi:predicted DsbA family dithiol-disulfide isomerase